MIKTVIFDLDGTLINSIADLGIATNDALSELGYPTHPIEAYNQFVGNGVTKLVERALPVDNHEDLTRVVELFNKYYDHQFDQETTAYDGIKQVLEYLETNNINLAVVTNKPKYFAIKLVKLLFPGKFSYVFGADELQPNKPDPTKVKLVMDLFDCKKDETIYIGDSDVDIVTAQNAKVKSIGCAYGFRGRNELKKVGADAIVDQPIEIIAQLNDWGM